MTTDTLIAKYRQDWYFNVMTCAGADCCRPYRRHWKSLARLHSVTDGGCRVRGVAYLHDRIYVIYSGCRMIGVYDGRQPFEPLDSICVPEARSFARYKFVTYLQV